MEDFEKLYSLYSKQLYKYLFYLCGDRHIAEELLQETYYQAMKSIFRFKGDSKVSTWLYQIGKNTYLKQVSKMQKENSISIDETSELVSFDTPEQRLANKEERLEFVEAVLRLSEQHREIVMLRLFEERSFKEIGVMLEQSEGWARTNFYRAKLQLRSMLSSREEEEII